MPPRRMKSRLVSCRLPSSVRPRLIQSDHVASNRTLPRRACHSSSRPVALIHFSPRSACHVITRRIWLNLIQSRAVTSSLPDRASPLHIRSDLTVTTPLFTVSNPVPPSLACQISSYQIDPRSAQSVQIKPRLVISKAIARSRLSELHRRQHCDVAQFRHRTTREFHSSLRRTLLVRASLLLARAAYRC